MDQPNTQALDQLFGMPAAAAPATASAEVRVWQSRPSAPLEVGGGGGPNARQISRVKYTHDAMIDLVIAQPRITQIEIAQHFGYSANWVSIVFNSDAFQARLAQRKADLVDPFLLTTIDDRLRAVASKSLEVVLEKLQNPAIPFDSALAAVTTATKALGMGQAKSGPTIQQSFVVAMPAKSEDAGAWAAKYGAKSPGLAAMMVGAPQEQADYTTIEEAKP